MAATNRDRALAAFERGDEEEQHVQQQNCGENQFLRALRTEGNSRQRAD